MGKRHVRFELTRYAADEELYKVESIDRMRIIAEGYWRDRHFVIGKGRLNYPLVYVECDDNPGDEYYGPAYWLPEDKRNGKMYYGWDHGHYGDYIPTDTLRNESDHKWTVDEILMEIAEFITEYPLR